jgi:hypothetical protein
MPRTLATSPMSHAPTMTRYRVWYRRMQTIVAARLGDSWEGPDDFACFLEGMSPEDFVSCCCIA